MDVTRRGALIGLSALVARPARAQSGSKNAPKQPGPEFATLEKPVVLDISTTTGSLKESVQKGHELVWHIKDRPTERAFQMTNHRMLVAAIASAAAAMTAVATQPADRRPPLMVNCPITLGFAVMCIMMTMTGTATTPLTTALQ
jgi:hypothetical protein